MPNDMSVRFFRLCAATSPTTRSGLFMREFVGDLYLHESRRVFSTLVRLVGDFDLAEEAMHDAFAAAIEQWQQHGVPANPRAWLVSTGRFKAIDALRRRAHSEQLREGIARRVDELSNVNAESSRLTISRMTDCGSYSPAVTRHSRLRPRSQ